MDERAQETDHRRCSCHRRTLWMKLRTDRGCSARSNAHDGRLSPARGRARSPGPGTVSGGVRGNLAGMQGGQKGKHASRRRVRFCITTPESGRSRRTRPHPEKLVDDLGASSRPDVTLPRISRKNACTASSSVVIHYYHLPVPNSGGPTVADSDTTSLLGNAGNAGNATRRTLFYRFTYGTLGLPGGPARCDQPRTVLLMRAMLHQLSK